MSFKRVVFIFISMCYIGIFSLRHPMEKARGMTTFDVDNCMHEVAVKQNHHAE